MRLKIRIKNFLNKWIKGQVVTPTQIISVFNQSTKVSDADVEKATLAVSKQLSRDVAPFWGLVPALEFVRKGGKPSPDSSPCVISDRPDVEGALGYHDEGRDGVSYIKVFCDPIFNSGGTALTGSLSVSAVLSHEVLELVGDGPANRWVDGPDGKDYAFELCDAVEDTFYQVDSVAVSNFLLPAFFDPQASPQSRLDFLGLLSKPFSLTPGGYQIVRTETGKVSQVWGDVFPSWKKPAKARKASLRRFDRG